MKVKMNGFRVTMKDAVANIGIVDMNSKIGHLEYGCDSMEFDMEFGQIMSFMKDMMNQTMGTETEKEETLDELPDVASEV